MKSKGKLRNKRKKFNEKFYKFVKKKKKFVNFFVDLSLKEGVNLGEKLESDSLVESVEGLKGDYFDLFNFIGIFLKGKKLKYKKYKDKKRKK